MKGEDGVPILLPGTLGKAQILRNEQKTGILLDFERWFGASNDVIQKNHREIICSIFIGLQGGERIFTIAP